MTLQLRPGAGAGVDMRRVVVVLIGLLAALVASPAFAHPHIFIDAKTAITFDDADAAKLHRQSLSTHTKSLVQQHIRFEWE